MSVHKINTTIVFKWSIRATPSALVKTDYDILVILPDGTTTYTDDGLTTYIAPTATSRGEATYNLAVTSTGRHVVTLAQQGTAASHIVQAVREIYVVDPPAHVLTGVSPKLLQGPEACISVP